MDNNIVGEYIDETLQVYWVADIRFQNNDILKNCWIYEKDSDDPINDYDKIKYILEYEYNKLEFQNQYIHGDTNCNCIKDFKIHKIIV
jgi:hypothetical protein